MNIIPLDSLPYSKHFNNKSLSVILENENTIKTALLLEELSYILSNKNNPKVLGNCIWCEYQTNTGGISINYDTNLSGTVKNIIMYDNTNLEEQEYNIYDSQCSLNFENKLYKSCYITCTDGVPTSIISSNGLISKLDLTGCPSIKSINFPYENNVDIEFLDLTRLYNFNSLSAAPSNKIKFIALRSSVHNKIFIIVNFTHGSISPAKANNISPWIQYQQFNTLTPFYFFNYPNKEFSDAELTLAANNNIKLVNLQ